MKRCDYKIDTGSDSNLVPIKMLKCSFNAQKLPI